MSSIFKFYSFPHIIFDRLVMYMSLWHMTIWHVWLLFALTSVCWDNHSPDGFALCTLAKLMKPLLFELGQWDKYKYITNTNTLQNTHIHNHLPNRWFRSVHFCKVEPVAYELGKWKSVNKQSYVPDWELLVVVKFGVDLCNLNLNWENLGFA